MWQAISFQGPTARQDAERAERNKWLDVFADLLLHLQRLWEYFFLRPVKVAAYSTLDARVRSICKFWAWLAAAHELPYPTTHMHLAEFLHVRLSEPCQEEQSSSHICCTRVYGGIGLRHGEVPSNPLNMSIKKELMAFSLPCGTGRAIA